MWQVKNMVQYFARRSLLLFGTVILLMPLALRPTASAQVVICLTPPVCSYGYYNYSPYGCAPSGYYGPGYFYNGIFLGVGPWANWGYGHGWGSHRFSGGRGGSYVGSRGNGGGRAYAANRGSGQPAVSAGARMRLAVARPHVAHTRQQRGVELRMALLTPQPRTVAVLTLAVAERMRAGAPLTVPAHRERSVRSARIWRWLQAGLPRPEAHSPVLTLASQPSPT